MSGSSSSNSWTILPSEESAAETLRPVAADTQQHDRIHASKADEPHCEENHKPPNGADSAEGRPVEDYLISKETSDQSGIPSSDHPPSSSSAGSRELIPPENPAQFTHSPTLSSDPQILTARSPDEPTSTLLGTETLGSAELTQDEKSEGEEGLHLQNEEQLHREDGGPDHNQRKADSGEAADVDEEGAQKAREVREQQQEEERRKSLLSALEQIGRRDEEEEEEEEFQMPQREDDGVLSLNKCILGAVILLGIGTIFFSGVLMDLDGEGDHVTREMRDAEAPGKQEWLSPEALPPLVDADGSELLNKLAKGNQQISVLQAQLQAQNEELKVARGQAAEGEKERQRWEEVEKENSRLKTEMASLPVLQNENERMKKELESVPALQKELKTLRSTVTELRATTKSSSSPPTGQPAERSQPSKGPWEEKEKKKDLRSEKFEASEKKQQKKREKPPWKEEEKQKPKDGNRWEWNKWKQEEGRSDEPKERAKRQSEGTQQLKGKDRKKEGADRGEDGKEKVHNKGEWMEKEWKKEKHVKVKQDQQRETKEWMRGKDREQKHRETQESEADSEQMKGKDGFTKSGKEWKEKGDKKEYGCRDNRIKSRGTEGKGGKHREDRKNGEGKTQKNENKQWNEYERKSEKGKQDKEWKGKDEKLDQRKKREENWKSEGAKEKKRSKDKQHSGKNSNEHKPAAHEHLYGDQAPAPPHTHRKPSVGHPEYWARQRTRLQHDPRAPQHCDSPEACAQAERLRPVPLAEFEAVLQNYLVKAQEAGVEESNREELRKLASHFFKDGVFMHTQMSFQSFAEDVADILEDFVDSGHEGEEDSELEDEMEGFEREVMEKFSVEAVQEKEERIRGQQRNRG